ncbi:MAG: hypothetical protein ABI639_13270 [Thermoanaerobaculia bacterium]
MDRMHPCRSLILSTLLSLVGVASARGQNALANPEFNSNILSWEDSEQWIASWTTADANSCEHSGAYVSTAIENPFFTRGGPLPSVAGLISSGCMDVTPGETVFEEVAAKSQRTFGLYVTSYPLPGCQGAETFPLQTIFAASPNWHFVEISSVVGAGVASVKFRATASDANGSGFVALWDRAYLGKRARVFADDFEGGSTCRWVEPDHVVERRDEDEREVR